MARHELPSGGWVELRDHRELNGHDVRAVHSAITGTGARAVVDMRAALIEALVTGWSYPYPLPATTASAGLLRADDYVKLQGLTEDAYRLVNGLSVVPDSDEHADPKAPTAD